MGIPGLIKKMKPLLRRVNIYSLARGRRVGIDGHVWLHQLAYQHAEDIVVNRDFSSLARDFLQRVVMAQGHGLELVIVFDGAPTPAKQETDQARRVRQQKALQKLQYDEEPDAKTLRAAVSLGWPAVKACLAELRKWGIPYVVAPYEADCQLAHLASSGLIWAAVTVDSDFILHQLERIFFAVNWKTGRGMYYESSYVFSPDLWPDVAHLRCDFPELVRRGGRNAVVLWSLAIGTDYGTKIPGVGPAKATKALQNLLNDHPDVVRTDLVQANTLFAAALKVSCCWSGQCIYYVPGGGGGGGEGPRCGGLWQKRRNT